MNFFKWLYLKFKAYGDNKLKSDVDASVEYIKSEIKKGTVQLQNLCIEEERIKSKITEVSVSRNKYEKELHQANKKIATEEDESKLKMLAISAIGIKRIYDRQEELVKRLTQSLESIQIAQANLNIQIAEASLYQSEISAGLNMIDSRKFKIDVETFAKESKIYIDGKNNFLDKTQGTDHQIQPEDVNEYISSIKTK